MKTIALIDTSRIYCNVSTSNAERHTVNKDSVIAALKQSQVQATFIRHMNHYY